MLSRWDATYRRDSAEAALYEAWRAAVGQGRGGRYAAAAPVGAGSAGPHTRRSRKRLTQAIERLTRDQGADWAHGAGDGCTRGRSRIRSSPPSTSRPSSAAGGAGTVAADGASYREILDVADWDRSMVTNMPGQSGQPESPFYGNLLPVWADDKYFPLAFSRPAVEKATAHGLTLTK